jgi:hypothetical protein
MRMVGPTPWRRNRAASFAVLSLITFTLILTDVPRADPAQQPAAGPPPTSAQAEQVVSLGLEDCLQLAFQRQPRIAAARASLAAAEDGFRALDNLMAPGVLVPSLPVRRRQASLGITAAAAGLDQAQRETAYAVTRTYFTVLYAREQERVVRAVVDRLKATRDTAKQALDAGSLDVTSVDVRRATTYLHLAQTKRIQASEGVKRALAALKEAIGLGPQDCLEVPAARLPVVGARPCREEVIAQALARRGELVRATIFAEVTCLEVEAQGTGIHKKMETFAAGSDIHAVVVPQGASNSEYKPGAVPPEMPTLLAGSRPDRVKRAQSFHARARAVVDVTRNLIALEAEDEFLRWEEAAGQAAEAREAAETGEQLAQDLNKDYAAGLKVKVEEVVNAHVLAAQARAQYNEYLYREILALAALERITAGGFCARLSEALVARPAPAKANATK